jgi:hypothetical protein
VVYDAQVLAAAVAVVVLKPGGVALVRRFWRVSSLFSTILSNFEVGKTGTSAQDFH